MNFLEFDNFSPEFSFSFYFTNNLNFHAKNDTKITVFITNFFWTFSSSPPLILKVIQNVTTKTYSISVKMT